MDSHQDEVPPARGSSPEANAQGYDGADGLPEYSLDFMWRQSHLLPDKPLVSHHAGQQLTQRQFLGRSAMTHD
jgi:hypothetical protein